jgi:hypothetical protein
MKEESTVSSENDTDKFARKIDYFLDTRNNLISYRTDSEKYIEDTIINNVIYVTEQNSSKYKYAIDAIEKLFESDDEEYNDPQQDDQSPQEINKADQYKNKLNSEHTDSDSLSSYLFSKEINTNDLDKVITNNFSSLNPNKETLEEYEKVKNDYQELKHILFSYKSKKDIVDNALKIACEKLRCQSASIFLFSSKDGVLKRVGIRGIDITNKPIKDSWFQKEHYRVGESFTGNAAIPSQGSKYGKTKVSNKFYDEPLKNRERYLKKFGKLNCAIAVPLNGRNKTYGVLRIINKLDENNLISDSCFSEETDLSLISFLGGAIAAAISNFHRDTQNEIFRYMQDSLVNSDSYQFDYSSFYQKILNFLTGSETAFKVAILRVRNKNSDLLEVRDYSAPGVTEKIDNGPRRLNQGFVGLVSQSLKPQIITSISKSNLLDKFINVKWIMENKLESFGCFPLIIPGQSGIVGTLSLFSGYEYEFDPSTIDFLNNVTLPISAILQKERRRDEVKQKFSILSQQWLDETGFISSTAEAVIHPAYQQIIGMGQDVVSLLLHDLNKPRARWFWALKSITGVDPVTEDQAGNTQEMINAWLSWGVTNGFCL